MTSTATITVTGTNDGPTATANSYDVNEGGNVSGNLIGDDTGAGQDSDPENDTLSVTHINGQLLSFNADGEAQVTIGEGVLTVKADGSFSYVHNGAEPAPTSFEYTVSDGSLSSNATVTLDVAQVNDAPVALDDPQGFVLSLGSFDTENGAWDNQGVASVDASFNGVSQGVSHNSDSSSVGIGVDSDANNGPATQIQYDRDSGESEKLSIKFDEPATEGKFKVSHLYAVEGGSSEQGKWTAYLNGVAIASGLFANTDGHVGEFDIDTNGFAFDEIVFEATEFTGGNQGKGDSSDYFLEGLEVSSEGIFAFNEDDVISIPVSELLSNDSDVDTAHSKLAINDTFNLVDGDGNPIAGASFELVGENVVVTLPENYYGKVSFEYNITDGDLTSNDATVSIVINPVNDAPTVSDLVNVVTDEDTPHVLTVSDFGNYSDVESDSIVSIKITSLPEEGVLEYKVGGDWVRVNIDQELTVADLDGDKVRFVPGNNESGLDYALIGFEVSDGKDYSDGNYQLNVDVTPVADAPFVTLAIGDPTSRVVDDFDYDKVISDLKSSAGEIKIGTDLSEQLFTSEWNSTHDYIEGHGSADHMIGYDGNDILFGGAGDDSLYGGNPSNQSDLTDGFDTAIYTGNYSDYVITPHDSGSNISIQLVDKRGIDTASAEGDRLYSIERLIFADGIYVIEDGVPVKQEQTETVLPVDITVSLDDLDGSEFIQEQSVTLNGVPDGVQLVIEGVVQTPNSDGSYTVKLELSNDGLHGNISAELVARSGYEGSLDFDLSVSATSQEKVGDDSATTTVSESATLSSSDLIIDTNASSTVEGHGGDDVIVADIGGYHTSIIPAVNYNIAIITDLSGSMDTEMGSSTRIEVMKDALINFVNTLDDHTGTINITLIGFGTSAEIAVDIQDLTSGNSIDDLISSIESLAIGDVDGNDNQDVGQATNYEAAFEQASNWFNAEQQNNDYQNLTLFLTDGKPTTHNGDSSSSGGSLDSADFINAIDDYQQVASKGTVRAIGIGNGINEDTLKFFDNSANDIQNQMVEFEFEDAITAKKGEYSYDTVFSFELADTNPQSAVLSFDIEESDSKGLEQGRWGTDTVIWWLVDKDNNTVASGDRLGTSSVTGLASGQYSLIVQVVNNISWHHADQDKVTVSGNLSVELPAGQVDIVNSGDELTAALIGETSNSVLAELGNDTVLGGRGDDILFGDAINSDDLPWGVDGNPIKPSDLNVDAGIEGIKRFLNEVNGSEPTQEELYDFIKQNHDAYRLFDESRGGDDVLDGGEGNDILFGQGGKDTLIGGLGDDILTGGEDVDIFKWVDQTPNDNRTETDTITDFQVGQDHIDVSQLLTEDDTMEKLLAHLSVDKLADDKLEIHITDSDKDITITVNSVDSSFSGISDGQVTGESLNDLINSLFTKLPESN